MTYKEESDVLDMLKEIQETIRSPEFKQLIKETHENNIILRQFIKVINTWIKLHPQGNSNDFNMNVIDNLVSSGLDQNEGVFKEGDNFSTTLVSKNCKKQSSQTEGCFFHFLKNHNNHPLLSHFKKSSLYLHSKYIKL